VLERNKAQLAGTVSRPKLDPFRFMLPGGCTPVLAAHVIGEMRRNVFILFIVNILLITATDILWMHLDILLQSAVMICILQYDETLSVFVNC
jgi:hypothetical protein